MQDLMAMAQELGASDIHLSAGEPPWLRIDGDLKPCELPAYNEDDLNALLRAALSEDARQRLGALSEVDCVESVNGQRVRLNVYRQRRGTAAALRIIPGDVPTLEVAANVDVRGAVPKALQAATLCTKGLVLVTGATGSGKTTTMSAIVNAINEQRTAHIITIEDPVEVVHAPKGCLVHQREVGRDTASFGEGLRAALREDPDVIVLGELRDLETIRLALTAAETGHLVVATLHTASAIGAVDRIVDVFPGEEKAMVRTMLAESLEWVLTQMLVPKRGGGRLAVFEALCATPAVRNLIRENKTAQIVSLMQTGRAAGMQTFEDSLRELKALDALPPTPQATSGQ